MIPISRKRWATTVLLASFAIAPSALRADGTLPERLRQLADQQGFSVKGLKRLEPVPAPSRGEDPAAIRRLLKGYDFVMEMDGPEHIRRVIILGKKRLAPPPPPASTSQEYRLTTRRQGEHHYVTATLLGNGGNALELEMMVDTGASLVVLPQSNAGELGLTPDLLTPRTLQTAKGEMQAMVGIVPELRLGEAAVSGVEVALVADESLGETALLGMNVLSRYLFILDDEKDQLILIPQQEKQ